MKTITDILPVIEGTARDVDNWIGRLELRTKYAETVRGRPRYYTRKNVLELAFLSAFIRVGIRPQSAVSLAEAFLEEHRYGKLREWIAVRAGQPDFRRAIATDSPDIGVLRREFGRAPLALVPVAEIARDVEALFSSGDDQE